MRARIAGLLISLLLPAWVAAQDAIQFKDFAWKSDSVDAVEQAAVQQVVIEAVRRVLPEPTTPQEKGAYTDALAEAQRQAGRLVKYTVTDGPRSRVGAPGYIVIQAEVSRAAIERLYHEQSRRNATSKRNCRVMVVISEEHRVERDEPGDRNEVRHEIRPDSKVAKALEKALIDAGYDVRNGNMHKQLQERNVDFSKLDGDDAKIVQQIAADQGCDILLQGYAKADGPDARDVGLGDTFYYWHADVTLTAVRTDDARSIYSEKLTGPEAGDRIRHAGSEIALERAADEIAGMFIKGFHPESFEGDIEVRIYGVKELAQASQIKKWIADIPGVKRVQCRADREVLNAQVTADLEPLELAEKIMAAHDPAAGFQLKLEDAGQNRLKGRVVPLVAGSQPAR
jgi:hypothetical protein